MRDFCFSLNLKLLWRKCVKTTKICNLYQTCCFFFHLVIFKTQLWWGKKKKKSQLCSLRTRQTKWVVARSWSPGMKWWRCQLEVRLMWEDTEPFPHCRRFWCELRVSAHSYIRTSSTNLWSGRGGSVWTSGNIFISWACDHSAPLLHRHPPTAFLSLWSALRPVTRSQLLLSARLLLQSKLLHPGDAALLSQRALTRPRGHWLTQVSVSLAHLQCLCLTFRHWKLWLKPNEPLLSEDYKQRSNHAAGYFIMYSPTTVARDGR